MMEAQDRAKSRTVEATAGGDPNDPQHQLDSVAWFAETVILPLRDREIAP